MDINVDFCQQFINFVIKSLPAEKPAIKNEITPNQQLAEELHKPLIKKIEK